MSEVYAVQNPMLRYATQIGWDYISRPEAMQRRNGDAKELYFTDTLKTQLLKLNPGVVNPDRVEDIIRRLKLIQPTIEGNYQALSWLRGEQSVFVPGENRERNVTLIDFDTPDNNIFHVTDEWRQEGTRFPNRADAVFLINGIPVAVAETKGEGVAEGLAKGIDQIRRYHNQTPEMMISSQVFEVTELWNFWYGVTWNTSRKNLFDWKEESSNDDGEVKEGNYERKIKTFFDRQRFLQILREYIIFITKDDQLTKVILRQHQTRAVEKVIQRVQDPNKRHGLIWHTQGSGKTLTMITIAALLLRNVGEGEKPTVLMVIDRNELENQLFKNIAGYGITSFRVAENKQDLEDIIASDYRGLVVAMIHKFDKMKARNERSSITVLVDEAHRTTGGDLGNYLMASLPNATYIGFTGTPISRLAQGKSTFQVFGVDDADQKYTLDQYSTAESIKDGTTLKLNYALARSDLLVNRELLEQEFFNLQETEGISDIGELNAILDRAVNLKSALKSEERVDKIAKFVAEHFRQYVETMGFKAFLVGVDRPACVLYKQALDKYLPPEYSQVVYSQSTDEGLREYNLTDAQEKEVRKAFIKKCVGSKVVTLSDAAISFVQSRPKDFVYNQPSQTLTIIGYCSAQDAERLENLCSKVDAATAIRELYEEYKKRLPKILIVTEKLLTGFDAPILYCMYLDKPMRDHVLLQAIARVNRPYEDDDGLIKPFGFVLDFVGIFDQNLQRALAFESQEVEAIIQNVDVLKNLFATLMRETAPQYLTLTRGWDDKAKERAAAHFADKDARQQFFKFVRRLQSLYDILSPDAFLEPFMENYKALVKLYGTIRNAYSDSPYVDKELTAKTKELLRQNISISDLEMPGVIYELGAEQLAELRQSDTTDTVKVLNLSKALGNVVREKLAQSPFLLSIGERADKVIQAYENRQINTQSALEQLEQIAQECVDAESAHQRLDVDENTFAIYTVLKQVVENLDVEQARAINTIYSNFPDYQWDERQETELRTEIYAALHPIAGSVKQTIEVTNNLLKLQRV